MLATLLTTSSIREFRAGQLRPDLNRALTATLIMCATNAAREQVSRCSRASCQSMTRRSWRPKAMYAAIRSSQAAKRAMNA